MKFFLVTLAFTVSCVMAEYVGQEKYTDKYDSLDLDEMMSNKRLMQAYCRCILDQGKCTAEGRELKSHISEALQNGCAKCTDRQRYGMRRVISYVMKNENDMWQQMVQKYDPRRIYTTKYEKELKKL
ncbi:ejaculatory bulb-specific protein 3-like [Pectinophora gossypiella]|uniref:ejaculatory bulb-specific protein 3-like n=1 Tax=Pectinophora gossypiella TaxID=13191 RepID=UPI00214F0C0A|nr:ejaculatory bulb-specific protein 3-like [Pectinophora gossypiella]XP_049876710.1 ejaculatory bulb-specific protein 3-like [Pectinophora gossypiella]XP_049876711.1 ejaculatory bulb-specific protein 3-like [Pectinophora gossypiella]